MNRPTDRYLASLGHVAREYIADLEAEVDRLTRKEEWLAIVTRELDELYLAIHPDGCTRNGHSVDRIVVIFAKWRGKVAEVTQLRAYVQTDYASYEPYHPRAVWLREQFPWLDKAAKAAGGNDDDDDNWEENLGPRSGRMLSGFDRSQEDGGNDD